MLRTLSWIFAALVVVVVTIIVALPAAFMTPLVERQTGGRITLGDPQGTLWEGSAFIGAAPGPRDPVTPLLPGRFQWKLSPTMMLGRVRLSLHNEQALGQDVQINGTWFHWQVSPSSIAMPAERLAALGAPLNTMQPSGRMRLSWEPLQLGRRGQQLDVVGRMKLDMDDIASRLSPVKPLGAYTLTADWQGSRAPVALSTRGGPLVLTGQGAIDRGRFQFSGRAQAAPGEEERLGNLLNLLGQRRRDGDMDYIALEFK